MAINRSSNQNSRRLSEDEINVAKENLRDFRDQIRDVLADASDRESEDLKAEAESAPMPDPFE